MLLMRGELQLPIGNHCSDGFSASRQSEQAFRPTILDEAMAARRRHSAL